MLKDDEHFAEKQKSRGGFSRIWRAFLYTCSGFAAAFRNEQAFRQEIFIFVPAAILVLISPIDWVFKATLLFPLTLILAVELINSAIEAVVDDISTEYRELAKRAKDFGSAAVFCSIVTALIIWVAVISHCFATGQFEAWFPYGIAVAAK